MNETWTVVAALALLGGSACGTEDTGDTANMSGINSIGGGGEDTAGTDGATSVATEGPDDSATSAGSGNADDGGSEDEDEGGGPLFDIPPPPAGDTGEPDCEELGNCECTIPEHMPCDAGTNDPFHAMGLNCPGELAVNTSTSGPATAIGVRSSFGGTNTFDPREGSVYAVLGSGFVGDLDLVTPPGDSNAFPTNCSDDLGAFDPGATLPAPLSAVDVGGDCMADPGLIGTGDCSNTIQAQFDQGGAANDYTEMRFDVEVPPDIVSFSYDFAFFSVEYPTYFGSSFNDMYVGWLESENWTGNISFDAMGNPISLNAGFLDFQDDAGALPEFAGTCMRQHAGTNWLTTTTGVTGGETITVAFAIFDLSDSILDSYVFLDNFEWGCEPTGGPSTEPEG
ncbi:MAG: choice-of-anchor L domain-containing protein [Myxococcota bacterium]